MGSISRLVAVAVAVAIAIAIAIAFSIQLRKMWDFEIFPLSIVTTKYCLKSRSLLMISMKQIDAEVHGCTGILGRTPD